MTDDEEVCEFCGEHGCRWWSHPEARADVAAWNREARSMEFPFGDHPHDAEL